MPTPGQSLSFHPYLDHYGRKAGAWLLVGATGFYALLELYHNLIAPLFQVDYTTRYHAIPQSGQFDHRIRVYDQPIPIEQWPVNHYGQKVFQPTYDWQPVPDDCVLPPGLEIRADLQGGGHMARAIRRLEEDKT